MVTSPTQPLSLRACVACGAPLTGGPKRRYCAPCKLARQRAVHRRYNQAQTAQRIHRMAEMLANPRRPAPAPIPCEAE